MATHIEVMRGAVGKPLAAVKKAVETVKSGGRPAEDIYLSDMVEELLALDLVKNKKVPVRRIFVHSDEGGAYNDVGWILLDDVEYCMLCKRAFGVFASKFSCHACGNVFCSQCSSQEAFIFEIQHVGKLRVCDLCCYGQELVYAVPRTKVEARTPLSIGTSAPTSQSGDQAPSAADEADKSKKLKMQQQAEFQREALARLQNEKATGSRRYSTLPVPPAPVAVTSTATQRASDAQSSLEEAPSTGSGKRLSASAPMVANANMQELKRPSAAIASSTLGTEPPSQASTRNASLLNKYATQMSVITPTPAFVIKTKRNAGVKIFVNITTHQHIPYKTESPADGGKVMGGGSGSCLPSAGGDGTPALNAKKTMYMCINTPFEYQNEKDGNYCVIYDVLVHPNEVYVCTIDSTGVARDRLCKQVLELVSSSYSESLDPNFVILRISNNYKGRDESGRLTVRPCYVPPSDAFLSLPHVIANPVPIQDSAFRASMGLSLSSRSTDANATGKLSIAVPGGSLAANERGSTVDSRGGAEATDSIIRDSAIKSSMTAAVLMDRSAMNIESTKLTLDKSLKAMILQKEQVHSFTSGRSFNYILDALTTCEVNLRDLVVVPEAGFVIIAKQVRPVMNIIINVCHHPQVGTMASYHQSGARATQYTLPNPSTLPRPLPFIIGRVVEQPAGLSMGQMGGSGGLLEMIVDVVIPTPVLLLAIQDLSGDLREELTKEVLQRLVALRLRLEPNFALPTVSGGYICPHPSALLGPESAGGEGAGAVRASTIAAAAASAALAMGSDGGIAPVINLTEAEKLTYSVAFVGKLFKQGHRFKSWKERLVYLNDTTNKLQYYDLKMVYQGEFVAENAFIQTFDNPAECSAPKETFAFKLHSYVSGGEYLYCYVKDACLRSQYMLLFEVQNRMQNAMSKLLKIPDPKQGWLKKQGHVVKNWKRRFFVLAQGVIKYYENNGQDTNGTSDTPKGSMKLSTCTVAIVINDEYNKPVPPSEQMFQIVDETQDIKLIMKAEREEEKREWLDAIRKHIEYARNYLE